MTSVTNSAATTTADALTTNPAMRATEVLMFQNGLMAGLPAWSVIGLGIAVSRANTPTLETTKAPALAEVKSRGFVGV